MSGGEIEWGTYGDSLGCRLATVRRVRGLSQEKLAELAGIHRNQVSNIERNVSSNDGVADPHMSTVYRLAAALEVSPAMLLPDVDQRVGTRSAEQESIAAVSAVEAALLAALEREQEPDQEPDEG